MRNSKIAVAIVASVGIVAASMVGASAASASSGSNSGTVTRGVAPAAVSAPACKQIANPAGYPAGTKLVNLSTLSDFTPVSQVGSVKFSPTMEKRSVPGSWATWGSPPDTESATPNILYTVGSLNATITLKKPTRKAFGAEVEPNPFEVHNFTAVYKNKGGKTLCSIDVDADGNAGARVLAAKVKKAVSMTISSDVDFSFGAIRSR